MLQVWNDESPPLDITVLGVSWVTECRHADYARVAARVPSGEWTDAVLTVYGSVDRGASWHATGETLTASARASGVIDCIGWTDLKVEVTTIDTGSGGEFVAASTAKGPR